jgi:hypothetical protein
MEQINYEYHKERKRNSDKNNKFENIKNQCSKRLFRNNSVKDYDVGIYQNTFSKNKDNSECKNLN